MRQLGVKSSRVSCGREYSTDPNREERTAISAARRHGHRQDQPLQCWNRFPALAWSPMTRPALCAASVVALASILSAQAPTFGPRRAASANTAPRLAPAPAHTPRPSAIPPAAFQKYLLRVPWHQEARGGPEHREARHRLFDRRALAAVGQGRRDARDRPDAAQRGRRAPDRRRARGHGGLDPRLAQGVRSASTPASRAA